MRAVKKHGGARPGSGPPPGPPTKVVRLPMPIATFAHKLAAQQKPGDVAAFFDLESLSVLRVPMMAWSAACGFSSPAEDYVDKPLDFNELLIEHPAATFAIRIEGDSMTGAGIFPGDIAVVDRARAGQRQHRAGAAGWRFHRQALSDKRQRGLAASRKSCLSQYADYGRTKL